MAKEDLPILNLSLPDHKRLLRRYVDGLDGLYAFEFTKVRPHHSNNQRGYLFGVVYPLIAEGIKEQWGESVGATGAHEICKQRFLARPIVCPRTGEVVGGVPPSIRNLDRAEMSAYIEKVIQFAADYLNVSVPPAAHYDADPAAARPAKKRRSA